MERGTVGGLGERHRKPQKLAIGSCWRESGAVTWGGRVKGRGRTP